MGGKGGKVGAPARPAGQQQWMMQQQQQRPGGVIQPVAGKDMRQAAPPQQPQAETFICYCTEDKDEIGIRTLVGEYREEGANHGRKFFKKTQKIPGHEDINVYLYFWDDRDGEAFTGWWFGNQVGGAQVWSRNKQATQKPPKSGWTIPWDGEVKPELVVAPAAESKQVMAQADAKAKMEQRKQEELAKDGEANVADWEKRVEDATLKSAEVELTVQEALEVAREILAGEADDYTYLEASKELTNQSSALAEVQKLIARESLAASQKAPASLKGEMMALGQRLRQLQASVKEELVKLKDGKAIKARQAEEQEKRVEEESKERELEEGYAKQLEEMLPPAMEKTDAAEEEVEKVAIAAAPLQIDGGEDLRATMFQAIKETEQRARTAQTSISEARRYISGKLTQVGRFAPNAKKMAVDEFTALQTRLSEMQNKLNPYKNMRQEYEQRTQNKKLIEDLSNKVSGAEIEVEKAAMMTAPLGGDSMEGIKETESALSAAQAALSQTLRLIDSKLKGSEKSPLGGEIQSLQERAKSAQEKLDDVRRSVKETQVRVAADTLLREVSEKVSHAEDELQKMSEAELPFLRGDKQTDMEIHIEEADKVAAQVHTAIAEAQTFVARKLVEVARFTEGPAKTVKEEIDMMQKRLEEGRERLQQFRASTADRKRQHLLEEVEGKVKTAEDEVLRMAEACRALSMLGAGGDFAVEGGRDAVEQANLTERSAQACLVVARKHLLQKTGDLKKLAMVGAGSGTELGRLQTRVNTVQQEIGKFRNTIKDAEERLRVKQLLSEVSSRLEATESDVDKVAAAAVASKKDDQPLAEHVEKMEKQTASAQTRLSTTAKLVDVKLKTASGFLREELLAMRSRIGAAEKKLGSVIASAKEQKDRLVSATIISEATTQVEQAETEVLKTGEAELPFLKGTGALPPSEAIAAIASCEACADGAQKSIACARTFVVQKLVDVKELARGPGEACSKDLSELQKRLDTCASKLAEHKKDTAERKRTSQMQASGEKVASVETAVQKLADTMTKFSDDKTKDISQEQAQAICEEIAEVESEAQNAVADARKFLAMRVQDAKNFADASRGSASADLAKLQSRLTQCQVELAKISKQCTEREQRFVAQKLLADATSNIDQLKSEVALADQEAKEMCSDDQSKLLTLSYCHSVVVALLGHVQKSGQSVKDLYKSIAQGSAVTSEILASWLMKMPEVIPGDATFLTEERAKAVAKNLGGKTGKLTEKAFQAMLEGRFVCTSSTPVFKAKEGGESAGTIEVGEGLVILEAAESGRAKCKLERNDTEAFIPVGTFKAAPPHVGRIDSIECFIKGVHTRCTQAAQQVDQKAVDLAHVKTGPLVEVKSKLQQMRAMLGQERSSVDLLKKRVSAAKVSIAQKRKEEDSKLQEDRCKAFTAKAVADCTKVLEAAEAKVASVIETAKTATSDLEIKQLEALKISADEALSGLGEAKALVAKAQESHEKFGGARTVLLESRVELTKIASRASTSERKLKAATDTVRAAYVQVAKMAKAQAKNALRQAARQSGKSPDELFDQVSGKKAEITEEQFVKFVKKLPDLKLSAEQISLVFHEYGEQKLRKPGFAKSFQEFCLCERPSDITSEQTGSDVVRRIEKGELFEILEGPIDTADGRKRVRGKALRDGKVGWVDHVDAKGTAVFRARDKPFLNVAQEASLYKAFDSNSKAVRQLQKDEVLELLEGPRTQEVATELAVRCKSKDGAIGWITIRDGKGVTFASPSQKLYVCKSTIAMTEALDIHGGKVMRKVDVGEALEVVGDEQASNNKDITRLKFRAVRDGKEGFVTLKGNQGTVYLAISDSHFVADKAMTLRAGAGRDSDVVKQIAAGDVLEGQEAPKEVKPDAKMGARVRSIEDNSTGWVVFTPGPKAPVQAWKQKYVCKVGVPVTAALERLPEAEGTPILRHLTPGEIFKAVEGPLSEGTGIRRVRLATSEDEVVGWATVRGPDGLAFLESA